MVTATSVPADKLLFFSSQVSGRLVLHSGLKGRNPGSARFEGSSGGSGENLLPAHQVALKSDLAPRLGQAAMPTPNGQQQGRFF